jgi:hypothetical protein
MTPDEVFATVAAVGWLGISALVRVHIHLHLLGRSTLCFGSGPRFVW